MSELTKLETLEKAVVDTKAAYDVAYDAYEAFFAAYGDAVADAYEDAAYAALVKAKRALARYLKEQQDNE